MNCHACTHSEAILRGDYDSNPWNELPCATCKLCDDTRFSIPLDEEHPPVPAPGFEFLSPDNRHPAADNSLLPAETLAQFVQGFLNLPPELRDVVAWRYQGLPYKEIAERQGTSTQLAEMRHKRAMRDWPVLKSLFPYKVARRKRRRSKK